MCYFISIYGIHSCYRSFLFRVKLFDCRSGFFAIVGLVNVRNNLLPTLLFDKSASIKASPRLVVLGSNELFFKGIKIFCVDNLVFIAEVWNVSVPASSRDVFPCSIPQ